MWEELKKYAHKGEELLEGVEEHVAILLARKLDAERRQEIVAAIDAVTTKGAKSAPASVSVDTTADTSAKGK